ncbi:uncharacterized protein BDW70DRAFT_93709 [Aspergillus foveolatus]|uniref:uncharacterized protein n=1 Tax=Aspergillus foveolatus TaxID=210207 RepID=UPI003CCDA932
MDSLSDDSDDVRIGGSLRERPSRQPTLISACEESAHYPVFDPEDPEHNPTLERNGCPQDVAMQSAYPTASLRWMRGLPRRSLRQARSGIQALRTGLRMSCRRTGQISAGLWSRSDSAGSSNDPRYQQFSSTVSEASTDTDWEFGTNLYRCNYPKHENEVGKGTSVASYNWNLPSASAKSSTAERPMIFPLDVRATSGNESHCSPNSVIPGDGEELLHDADQYRAILPEFSETLCADDDIHPGELEATVKSNPEIAVHLEEDEVDLTADKEGINETRGEDYISISSLLLEALGDEYFLVAKAPGEEPDSGRTPIKDDEFSDHELEHNWPVPMQEVPELVGPRGPLGFNPEAYRRHPHSSDASDEYSVDYTLIQRNYFA